MCVCFSFLLAFLWYKQVWHVCVRVLHLVSVVVEYVIALLHACINPVNYERYSYTRFTISLTDTLQELNTRTHTRWLIVVNTHIHIHRHAYDKSFPNQKPKVQQRTSKDFPTHINYAITAVTEWECGKISTVSRGTKGPYTRRKKWGKENII